MDDDRCRQFFLDPQQTFHRRYEAFRAVFVEGRSIEEAAQQFGYRTSAFRSLLCRFRVSCCTDQVPPFFNQTGADGLRASAAAKTGMVRSQRRLPTVAN